nr:cell division control protein 48 homolog C-like [Tanacetum cinerariifolium]
MVKSAAKLTIHELLLLRRIREHYGEAPLSVNEILSLFLVKFTEYSRDKPGFEKMPNSLLNDDSVNGNVKEGEDGPRFKDLGGMDDVLDELKREVIVPLYHLELPRSLGVRPMTGILFHGPPGLNFEGHPMPLLAAMLSQYQEGKGAGMNLWEALSICLHPGPLKLPLQKVNTLETELKDHKKIFKDVVGKLVKKVKAMEVKLRTTKRKMVVSGSDQEERGKQDVDLDALLALANAAVTVNSNISPGGASNNPAASTSIPADVPTSTNVPTGSTSVPVDVPTSVAPAGVSNKGKAPIVEEDIPVKERTFKQMQEDRLGEQAVKRLHNEEQAQVDRQRAKLFSLFEAIASISSIKTIDGAVLYALANRSRMFSSDAPDMSE